MPYSGTLMTRVFTSRSQLPVEDAAVSILQHEPGGRQRLINIQTSDRSGNTVPTIIETPSSLYTRFCSFKTFKFSLESPVFKICP